MPAVERDDDRWQQALKGISELSQQELDLRKMIQSGFNVLGTEVDILRQQIVRLEADGALRARMQLWLLVTNAINGIGWLLVAGLLLYGIMRLFSVVQ
jgi:hypothetical protein